MDGRASLEEIAHKLVEEFPRRFSSWQETPGVVVVDIPTDYSKNVQALSYAGAVSQEYSR